MNDLKIIDGGCRDWRDVDADHDFASAIRGAFGERLVEDEGLCAELWAALANIDWIKGNDRVGLTFRAAGDLIAALRQSGGYMDWYCSAPAGRVSSEIEEEMLKQGWRWEAAR